MVICLCVRSFVFWRTSPFYRPRLGSATGTFSRKELRCFGKIGHSTLVKSCWFACASIVRACLVMLFMAGGMGDEEPQHHHYRLYATPTTNLRSMGQRGPSCCRSYRRPMHSSIGSIGHEWIACLGAIGQEWKVDQHSLYGSMLGAVNTIGHLCRGQSWVRSEIHSTGFLSIYLTPVLALPRLTLGSVPRVYPVTGPCGANLSLILPLISASP